LGRVIAYAPNDPGAYSELGNVWRRRQGWEDAAQAFSRAVDLDPFYLDAYAALAECYEKLGDPRRAGRFRHRYEDLQRLQAREGPTYDQVVAHPADANAWLDWGRLQLALGRYPQAADGFRGALQRHPG